MNEPASEVHVRDARLEDAEAIAAFNERLAVETEGKTLDPETIRRGVAAVLSDPARGRYFVAEAEGEVVAQLMLTTEWSDWRNGDIWWLQSVYVAEPHRRRGLFRALFEHARREAERSPEVVGLRLYVERENAVAQATYRRLGFRATSYDVMEHLVD